MHLDRGGLSVSLSSLSCHSHAPHNEPNALQMTVSLFWSMESLRGEPKQEPHLSAHLAGCPWRLIPGRGEDHRGVCLLKPFKRR